MTQSAASIPTGRQRLTWQVVRLVFGLLVLFGLVTLLAHTMKPQLEAVARWFFETAGYFGMALGTLLADGFFFPVPPQFYMLLGIASNAPEIWMLGSIGIGSIVGGVLGFACARRLSEGRWLRQRLSRASVMKKIRGKARMKTMVALSATPVAFSWLIYFCGLNRYPARYVAVLCALRIPKLLVYYWLVRAGWAI